tara:strand:+ start:216 stop:398 length:183 start_codon:yes stop_codon:yes gene_type:complete
MTTRRIRKNLQEFFDQQGLTDKEKIFIAGCKKAQQKHPQLTSRQWQIICEIEQRYKKCII